MFDYDKKTGEIWIYGVIGPKSDRTVDAMQVKNALRDIGNKRAHIHFNSPGGHVDEGVAMAKAISDHKAGVTTYIDSLAASIASYIFQKGDRRVITSEAAYMIHRPMTLVGGNSNHLRAAADTLDKYEARIAKTYSDRSNKSPEEIAALLAAETYYFGNEIIDSGFADEIEESMATVQPAMQELDKWATHIPDRLQSMYATFQPMALMRTPEPEPVVEVEAEPVAELTPEEKFPRLFAAKMASAAMESQKVL